MLKPIYGLTLALSSFFVGPMAAEARVLSCTPHEPTTCTVQVRNGIVGDTVRISGQKGQTVAKGKITDLKGSRATVLISEKKKEITRKDFATVTMEGRGSNLQWGAAFSKDD